MFRDEYKEFMNKQNPSDEAVKFVKFKIKNATKAYEKSPKKSKLFGHFKKSLMGVAACLAVVVAIVPMLMQSDRMRSGGEFADRDFSYEQERLVVRNLSEFYEILLMRENNTSFEDVPVLLRGDFRNYVLHAEDDDNFWSTLESEESDNDINDSPGGMATTPEVGIASMNRPSEPILSSRRLWLYSTLRSASNADHKPLAGGFLYDFTAKDAYFISADGQFAFLEYRDYAYIIRLIDGQVDEFLQVCRQVLRAEVTSDGILFYFQNP